MFKLMINSSKVLMIDIDWDILPLFITKSASKYVSWKSILSSQSNTDLLAISNSIPTKELKFMFEQSDFSYDSNLLASIFR